MIFWGQGVDLVMCRSQESEVLGKRVQTISSGVVGQEAG